MSNKPKALTIEPDQQEEWKITHPTRTQGQRRCSDTTVDDQHFCRECSRALGHEGLHVASTGTLGKSNHAPRWYWVRSL